MSNTTNSYIELVEFFGNQEKTALAIGVSQPAVSHWVKGKKEMSPNVATRAEKATNGKFKAVDLCPLLKEFQLLTAHTSS